MHHAEKRKFPGTYMWQQSMSTDACFIAAAGADATFSVFLRIVAEINSTIMLIRVR